MKDVLTQLAASEFFVVAHDEEIYDTKMCLGATIIATWKEIMYHNPSNAESDHVNDFMEFAENPDNWIESPQDDKPARLTWPVGGESSGTIEFFRIIER